MISPTHYFFYVGTEAELLKLLPVIREFESRKIPYQLIFSGQNQISKSHLFQYLNKAEPDVLITKKQLKQSVLSLLTWFGWAFYRTLFVLKLITQGLKGKKIIIVHGDTLSTVIGSVAGKIRGFEVAHVESGYRSFNWLQPFPEEIDRVIVSYFADYHFYPSQDLLKNIQSRRGQKICTYYNTSIETLSLAKKSSKKTEKYFIFIMHRQENLLNKQRVQEIFQAIDEISQTIKCIFIRHKSTEELVRHFHFSGDVQITPKLNFSDFITLLNNCEFIVTDGGGNQQESYFLGVPCLILRNVAEGKEGIGTNALLSKLDVDIIKKFAHDYKKYRKERIVPKYSPSKIIVDTLVR